MRLSSAKIADVQDTSQLNAAGEDPRFRKPFRSPFKIWKDWRAKKKVEEEAKYLRREEQVSFLSLFFCLFISYF
jgi:hypothetical protein